MLDLSFWTRLREELEESCERMRETMRKAGCEPVAKSNGHNGHRPALARAMVTGAARRRGWR